MKQEDSNNSEVNEIHEQCAGCCKLHPASELVVTGDGSIKVCEACRAKAAEMVQE